MTRRRAALALAVATAVATVVGLPSFSSASYVRTTTATATVGAAADWTPPTVSMTDPGATVKGAVSVSASASDGETGVASVTLQQLAPNSGAWVTVCTVASAPYSCSWQTVGLADGSYSLRAVAVDRAGLSTTSTPVSTTVANNLLVVLSEPADVIRGLVPLSATVFNPGTVSYAVRIDAAPAGTTSWKSVCTDPSAPYTCDWSTTAVANQDYDLRAVALVGTSNNVAATSATVVDVTVDNLAPTVSMAELGSPLRGTVTLSALADDVHSGIARVVIQHAASGSGTWRDACTLSESPYSCDLDTTQLADGSWSFRAIATDLAGNASTSTVLTRSVDNTVSSVSVTDPGAYLRGTVTVGAAANSTAGVTSVRIQRATAGTTAWTDLCVDSEAPFSCVWDTTTVPDGGYDLRAVLVDGAGRTATSAVIGNRRVDNTPFRGVDVQTTNGGAIVGRPDAGDQVLLTFSDLVAPGSVLAGWDGNATAVTVRLRDGNLLGTGNKGDTLDVQRTGATVNLGGVNLREDYVKKSKTVLVNATMSLTTVTINGVPASRVTLILGGAQGTGLRTVSMPAAMVWSPLASVLNLGGRAVSTAPVTESGVADREF